MEHKRQIEIIKLNYIQDLYIRINDGIVDLPPPPPELTGPNGQLLYIDEDFRKTLKKLDNRRQKLIKQKNKDSTASLKRHTSKLVRVKLERPPQVDPELDYLSNVYNESEDFSIKQEVDIFGENIRTETVRPRTSKRISSRFSRLQDQSKRQKRGLIGPNTTTTCPSSFSADEFLNEIEKDKRLIIMLKPLPYIYSLINATNKPSLTKKRKQEGQKLTNKPQDRSFIYAKKLCSIPGCGAMIATNTMPNHLRSHARNGNKVRVKPQNRLYHQNKGENQVCPYCGQLFINLDYHISVAHDGRRKMLVSSAIFQHKKPVKSAWCSKCLENFENEASSEYFLHMKSHDPKWQMSCRFCANNLSTFDEYSRHLLTLHPYQCPVLDCNEAYVLLNNLKEHMRENHPEMCKEFGITLHAAGGKKSRYFCSSCPESFSTPSLFRDHLYVHEDPDKVTCKICNRIFKRRKIYKAHMINSHGELIFKCTVETCDKLFSSLHNLRQHLYYHNPESTRVIYRKNKKNVTRPKDKLALKEKEGLVKSDSKTYKCDKGCDTEFSDYSRYYNHLGVFHNEMVVANGEFFMCPIDLCLAKSESKKGINLHIKYEHPEYANILVKNAEKKFKCSYCDRSYNYQHALKDHEISHTDPTQTTCDICNKFYTSKLLKNSHVKEAHGSKKIQCPNCSTMFSTEVNMRRHLKSVHHVNRFIIMKIKSNL